MLTPRALIEGNASKKRMTGIDERRFEGCTAHLRGKIFPGGYCSPRGTVNTSLLPCPGLVHPLAPRGARAAANPVSPPDRDTVHDTKYGARQELQAPQPMIVTAWHGQEDRVDRVARLDTEEVTGSIPVSPTTFLQVRGRFRDHRTDLLIIVPQLLRRPRHHSANLEESAWNRGTLGGSNCAEALCRPRRLDGPRPYAIPPVDVVQIGQKPAVRRTRSQSVLPQGHVKVGSLLVNRLMILSGWA
jgi:hypothetical protein